MAFKRHSSVNSEERVVVHNCVTKVVKVDATCLAAPS